MPKVTDLMKTTAHSQAAEIAALCGVASPDNGRIAELEAVLQTAIAKQNDLLTELEAEKEAHAKTSAALAAAAAAPPAA